MFLLFFLFFFFFLEGGKDGLIKMWDKSLIAVGQVVDLREDISPGADKKSSPRYLKTEIVSLQQWSDPTSKKASSEFPLLVSTRGSDIFEVYVSKSVVSPHSINLIACGHYRGELWGLAVHPLREEFATCGDDKTLRIWSIKSHQQLDMRVMPDAARSIAYSPTGTVLCVGMVDGSMALIDCQSAALKVFSTWKHTEVIITGLSTMYYAVRSSSLCCHYAVRSSSL
jgi:WD40 repeat protein